MVMLTSNTLYGPAVVTNVRGATGVLSVRLRHRHSAKDNRKV